MVEILKLDIRPISTWNADVYLFDLMVWKQYTIFKWLKYKQANYIELPKIKVAFVVNIMVHNYAVCEVKLDVDILRILLTYKFKYNWTYSNYFQWSVSLIVLMLKASEPQLNRT